MFSYEKLSEGSQVSIDVPGWPRASNELALWIYSCWAGGRRKFYPTLLTWYAAGLGEIKSRSRRLPGRDPASLADVDPDLLVKDANLLFQKRHGRMMAIVSRGRLRAMAVEARTFISTRCRTRPWWSADVWDLALDPRIPRRDHEPAGGVALHLDSIEPDWLREGTRFWLAHSLTYDQYTWTSCLSRAQCLAARLGHFATLHGLSSPLLVEDPRDLRPMTTAMMSWLRSPDAAANPTRPGARLSATSVDTARSTIQRFYDFMADHPDEAARFTGDPRWIAITGEYTRLWPPDAKPLSRRGSRNLDHKWLSNADLAAMMCCLPILTTPKGHEATVELPGGRHITSPGFGDPQAARAWLLQAMTGRRVSEILMLDFDPIQAIDARPAPDGTGFVARLRYQQTKVAGVDPTILIEQETLNIIREQQAWLRATMPDIPLRYLFVGIRNTHTADRPRPRESHIGALRHLDEVVDLRDTAGKPVRFTQTHRLRHTRATELLNAGVPIHVVQRYLGHRSPEMTMRYAQTLAETAEAEFLRYAKIGADARDITIDPQDLCDMAQLDRRADRILPNGCCLLPPTQACDRGNACLSCGHFATDRTHIDDLRQQRSHTHALVQQRQEAFTARHGTPMGPEHVWLSQRTRELAALDAIIDRLAAQTGDSQAIRGPGAPTRPTGTTTPIDGAHHTVKPSDPATTRAPPGRLPRQSRSRPQPRHRRHPHPRQEPPAHHLRLRRPRSPSLTALRPQPARTLNQDPHAPGRTPHADRRTPTRRIEHHRRPQRPPHRARRPHPPAPTREDRTPGTDRDPVRTAHHQTRRTRPRVIEQQAPLPPSTRPNNLGRTLQSAHQTAQTAQRPTRSQPDPMRQGAPSCIAHSTCRTSYGQLVVKPAERDPES